MKYTESIEIHAAPERVWEVMTDVERWPEWTASVRSVVRLDDGPLRVGSRARIHQPKFPPVIWEVTQVDRGHSFTWEASSVGLHTSGGHSVRRARDGGSLVELSIVQNGVAGPLAKLLFARITRRYLKLEAEGLRARAEASAAR